LILAFDTAAAHCAAALLSGDQVLAQAEEPMQKGQAERLLGLCHELLQEAGQTFSALDAIGVGIGPGNFTGIRIAVSTARGLALGLGIPAVGVSGFDALAHGSDTPCTCIIDAKRGDVYAQAFGAQPWGPALVPRDSATSGTVIGMDAARPQYPAAIAIGRIAARRYRSTDQRPAPLYLRPADAAPARDAPPAILT
jgi:N6-L-threonylcarbamoyladenine synthase